MNVEYREAKSIITKSNIPSIDYVINPYVGCQHACVYCYAEFMIRFTGHKGEKWGEFLDVKKINWNRIKPEKYEGKRLLLSSVTDPYLPLEKKFENTRNILEHLVGTKAKLMVLTKSNLVVRDIDLFKQIENIEVGISINTLDETFARKIEPRASRPKARLKAIREIHQAGIPTYVFISPIFPEITDFKAIIEQVMNETDLFMFENLNFRPHNVPRIFGIIKEEYPELFVLYKEFKKNHTLWDIIADEIRKYCEDASLKYRIEFHHGGFSKS